MESNDKQKRLKHVQRTEQSTKSPESKKFAYHEEFQIWEL